MASRAVPSVELASGVLMPQLGLGTSPLTDDEVVPAVVAALECGYRLIDTAEKYGNEAGVGEGMRASGVAREDVFVTTKLDGKFQGGDQAVRGLDESLARLGLDYVDLLLIHWPLPQRDLYVDTWRVFQMLHEAGKTRAVGVSNFKPAHLDRLQVETGTTPAVNQIQLNPGVTRNELRAYHAQNGIVTEAYSPLGAGSDILKRPVVRKIAERYDKSPAQVVLRWHVQLGLIPIPRSADAQRIAQNIEVFDFTLAAADVATISALDQGEAAAPDSDVVGH